MQTVPEESRAQGNIGFKLYLKYLTAGAHVLTLLLVALFNILAQVCGQQAAPMFDRMSARRGRLSSFLMVLVL